MVGTSDPPHTETARDRDMMTEVHTLVVVAHHPVAMTEVAMTEGDHHHAHLRAAVQTITEKRDGAYHISIYILYMRSS